MDQVPLDEPKRGIGWLPYVLAGLSFIPLAGVPFGLVAIFWGLLTRRRGGLKLTALGSAGITTSAVAYGALFYFGFYHRGGIFDELRSKMARGLLTNLVREIEYFKIQHGRYPALLEELKPEAGQERFISIYDPNIVGFQVPQRPFYYELQPDGTHYYLLSVGRDGQPYTADDILPGIPEEERSRIGLLVRR
jgi:hypothetical protein